MNVQKASKVNSDRAAKTFGKYVHHIFLEDNEEAVLSFAGKAPDSVFVLSPEVPVKGTQQVCLTVKEYIQRDNA